MLLVIEDEPLVAFEMTAILQELGARVVGPAGSAEEALRIITEGGLDGAFLDGNLQGRLVDDLALALEERNVPFLFVSGYGKDHLPQAFDTVAVLAKPFAASQLIDATMQLIPETEPE